MLRKARYGEEMAHMGYSAPGTITTIWANNLATGGGIKVGQNFLSGPRQQSLAYGLISTASTI